MAEGPNDTTQRLATVETEITGLKRLLDALTLRSRELEHQLNLSQRTPWPILLGGLSVFIALGSSIGAIYVTGLNEFKESTVYRTRALETLVAEGREKIAARTNWGERIEHLERRMDRTSDEHGSMRKAISDLETVQNRTLDAVDRCKR